MGLLDDKPKQKDNESKPTIAGNVIGDERETILLFGAPKVGKTWAYMTYIKETIDKGNNVYLINTDDGVSKTFKQYFGDEATKYAKGVKFYPVGDIGDVEPAVLEIRQNVTPHDLIVIDLISDFWELSQDRFIEEMSNDSPVGFITKMSKDTKSFGLFEGIKWQYIKKLDGFVTRNLVINPKCNIVAVAADKDLDVADKMSKGGAKKDFGEFVELGVRPAGQKQLRYKFNTIVYIGQQANQRCIQIMGDRGSVLQKRMLLLDKELKDKLEEEREKKYEG